VKLYSILRRKHLITFQTKISRTKPFSPSKLSLLNQCKLSYLLQTEKIDHKIPAGAHSYIGTAIHRTIEQLLPLGNSSGAEIKSTLEKNLSDSLLKSSQSSPILNWAISKNSINKIYDHVRLLSAIQQVKNTIGKYSANNISHNKFNVDRIEVKKNQLGSERIFEVGRYDLAGSIDYSFLDLNNIIHVIDFKSGKIFDDGVLKDEYLSQIGLYGLMVKEYFPNNEIFLEVIGANDYWGGTLDRNLESKLIKIIESTIKDIPLGVNFTLESLAQLGEHCSTCRARSACPKYFEVLETGKQSTESKIVSKGDLYGEVEEVIKSNELLELKLKSSNNITLSINGLPDMLFQNISIGSNLACYNLKFYDHEALCSFPANFYVYRPDIPKISAFEAVLAN
jgi:hypothetical protein